MAKSNKCAGQYNLKGKKYHLLSCRCCEVIDLRPRIEERRWQKEKISILRKAA